MGKMVQSPPPPKKKLQVNLITKLSGFFWGGGQNFPSEIQVEIFFFFLIMLQRDFMSLRVEKIFFIEMFNFFHNNANKS